MNKQLLFILVSWAVLSPAFGQRVMEWSIGDVQVNCSTPNQICYPLMVSISNGTQTPELSNSTIRIFFDAGYLTGLNIANISNGYTVSGLNQSNNVYGGVFNFTGGGGIFAQFNLLTNNNNRIALSTTPVHVLDFCFNVQSNVNLPLCAPIVFDNNHCGWNQGIAFDDGYLTNDAGMVGTYYLNGNINDAILADDEVTNYLWTENPAFDCRLNSLADNVGMTVGTGCIENICNATIGIVKTSSYNPNTGLITYTYSITNNGTATLYDIAVIENSGSFTGTGTLPVPAYSSGGADLDGDADAADLAINASMTFTATYAVTQADINAGVVTNQARATGYTAYSPNPVTDLSDNNSALENDPTQTILPQNPSIAVIKTGTFMDMAPLGVTNPGDQISYTFTVTNTGNVTLTNVTVTDPLVTVSGGPIASLAPGASDNSTFTATYTITQANINSGNVTNQATATGTPPTGPNATDLSDNNSNLENDQTVTPLTQTPSIAVIKTGTFMDMAPLGVTNPGDQITYTFTVTNTGNVTLTNVTVTDPLVTVSGGPIASLAPGASDNSTFTATYTITQANINSGNVTNQATATGTPPTGPNVTDLSDNNSNLENDQTVTPLTQTPSIAVVKTGTFMDMAPLGVTNPGDQISYAFTVTNTGNVTLTNVTITDPLATVSGGPIASLAPGASNNSTFTAIYTITQANINSGNVTNQATATGTPPTGPNVTDLSDNNSNLENDQTVTPLTQTPSIAVVKTGTFMDMAPLGVTNPGDQISYAFTVTNTGNVTLTNVTITDPLATVSGGPIASLAPGASDNSTFTATYTITQANINSGNVTNQATATGTPPTGPNVTDLSDNNSNLENDQTVTPLTQTPSIAVVKTGTFMDTAPLGVTNPGDQISYAFTVTNTGNVTLTNVTITDPLVTVSGGPIASLAPGASDNSTFTATYTITQANINSGNVTNQATATGTPPTGPNVTDLSDNNSNLENDQTVTPLTQTPSIAVIKTGTFMDMAPLGVTNPGDQISYTFTVTNTGNVTLTNVTVTDPLVTVSGGPIASLAPGASNNSTFTATYTITQANINSGNVTNQATATGTPPTGPNATDLSDNNSNLENDPTVTTLTQTPSIAVIKTGTFMDTAPLGVTNPGDQISYAFTVTNTGNVTLTNVTITDPLATVSGGPIASLAPGASDNSTFTAIYTITQANINSGNVTNQATATGTPPTGPNVTDLSDNDIASENDPTITPLTQTPSLSVVKTDVFNDQNSDGFAQIGETITYTIVVTNTGNVTISNPTVTDPAPGVDAGSLSCTAPASLAPGASYTCTAVHTISQADLNAGSVTCQATASGTTPNAATISDLSDDPDNPANVDVESDGEPDDPTVTTLNVPAILFGHLYVDLNGNGTQNAGEPDLAGVDVVVTNSMGAMFTVATNASGNWQIYVIPGSTSINVAETDPQFPPGAIQTEGTDPTVVMAVSAVTSNAGNDGYNPCTGINIFVYLEGSLIVPQTGQFQVPMRTTLNTSRLLPGQFSENPFSGDIYTPILGATNQAYNIAPWNYAGSEGALYNSGGSSANASANYPAGVVDWVLVSLRTSPSNGSQAFCKRAGLLFSDGHIEFAGGANCCNLDATASYYIVIEHRNHLIVMSHAAVSVVNGQLTYDFRSQQSYVNDPFNAGNIVGQKQVLPGVYAMYAGNGDQTSASTEDTDITASDLGKWINNGPQTRTYNLVDYNMDGEVSSLDFELWQLNSPKFTSVPRD